MRSCQNGGEKDETFKTKNRSVKNEGAEVYLFIFFYNLKKIAFFLKGDIIKVN